MAESDGDISSLSEIFQKGWKAFNDLETHSSNTVSFQDLSKQSEDFFVLATKLVNSLQIFSTNETIAEVQSSHLRYLLLPAFLGSITNRKPSENRLENLRISKVYLKDFLTRCQEYAVTEEDLSRYIDETPLGPGSAQLQAQARQSKIARYKSSKQLKDIINMIEQQNKDLEDLDDEDQRNYYLSWIRWWINEAIEDITTINSEIDLLEKYNERKGKPEEELKPQRKPIKPFLITKDMIRKKVFGAGYPSLPTMSEQEYFEKEVREGKIVLDYDKKSQNNADEEESKSDKEDEIDEDEKLQKDRKWDEYKDDHRRGEGNRKDRA